jgi:hypothetical protein
MTLQDIANLRLVSQKITQSKFKHVKDLVSWMGAIQAQDYNMMKWALGVRLPDTDDQTIESALDEGTLIRTHVLRPTWHVVSADDVYWMLELTAPHVLNSMKSRHKELGLTEAIFKKSNAVIEKALATGKQHTRDELYDSLVKAKIVKFKTIRAEEESQRVTHLIFRAELDRIACSGVSKGKERTYALFDARVIKKKKMKREEALAELAQRYFSSHGPATLQDFVWWSGLPVSDARAALEMNKPKFRAETIAAQTYWFSNSLQLHVTLNEVAFLLPAFDEFIISYKDRSASLPVKNQPVAISSNGIFRPVVVVNGQVKGLWRRSTKKNKAMIELQFFKMPARKIKELLEHQVVRMGRFMGLEIETQFSHL